jgi:hypothetical protein
MITKACDLFYHCVMFGIDNAIHMGMKTTPQIEITVKLITKGRCVLDGPVVIVITKDGVKPIKGGKP